MKFRRKAPTPECEKIKLDTKVQEEGFGEILKESTYARAGSARRKEFFFGLMPCALKAQTVINTFV